MSSVQNLLNTSCINMITDHITDVYSIETESYTYPWSEKIFLDCVNNNYLCRVLLVDDQIIGYIISSIVQDECHIMNLCIKKNFRKFGYARYVLNELHAEIKVLGCKMVFLECRPSNEAALRLYNSEGYNEIGIRKNYYPTEKGHEDALMLVKNVN